jgi:hypothetical protein
VNLWSSDLSRNDAGLVDLNRRVDGIRNINSITLRKLIDSDLESGREIFRSFRVMDALPLLRKLADSRAAIALKHD